MNLFNRCKRMICVALCLFLIMGAPIQASSKTIKISNKSLVIKVGKKKQVSIIGVSKKKKIKWKSSNKKVATVSSKGVIKAKKPGNVKITGVLNKKKYICSVRVIKGLLVTQIVANGKLYDLRQQTKTVVKNMCKDGLFIWNTTNPVSPSELVGSKGGKTVFYETMIDPLKLTRITKDPKSGKEVKTPAGSIIRISFSDVKKQTGNTNALPNVPSLENNLGAKVLWVDSTEKEYADQMSYPSLHIGESSFSKQKGMELNGACLSGYTSSVNSTRKVIIFKNGKALNIDPYLVKAESFYNDKDNYEDIFALCKTILKNLGVGITVSDLIDYSNSTDSQVVYFTSGERFVEEYSKSYGKEMFVKTLAFVMAMNDLLTEYSDGKITDFGTYEIQKESKEKDGIHSVGITLFAKKDYGDSLKSVLQ